MAAAVICLVGVFDDIFDLPPLAKFAGQVLAAGIAVALGVKMLWIPLPGQTVSLDAPASIAITVFFIVLCSNAVNFVDGLDGLATGVVGIGALAFFAYSYLLTVTQDLTRATTSSLITVAIAGACLGFLPHNFFPARMFMGDSGAMLLGLLLATSTISLTGRSTPPQLQDGRGGLVPTVLPLVLPLAILALPFLDLVLAFIRRTYAGKLVVRRRQAAPAPPPARTRSQPAPGGAADVRLVGAGLLRGDRPRPGPHRPAVGRRRGRRGLRAGPAVAHTGPAGKATGRGPAASRSKEAQLVSTPNRLCATGGASSPSKVSLMTGQPTESAPPAASGPSIHVIRARKLLLGGAVGGVAAALVSLAGFGIGYGRSGLISAALAAAMVCSSTGLGQYVMVRFADAGPYAAGGLDVSYTARVVILGLVLLLYNKHHDVWPTLRPMAIFITTIAVVAGWLIVEIFVFSRLRIGAYDTEYVPPSTQNLNRDRRHNHC